MLNVWMGKMDAGTRGFHQGDAVVLNTGDTLRMSVRRIEGDELVCQWVAGDRIREATFHRSQLRAWTKTASNCKTAGYIINLTGKEIPDLIREAVLVGAGGYADAIEELSIDELRQLIEYATGLRLDAENQIALKAARSSSPETNTMHGRVP